MIHWTVAQILVPPGYIITTFQVSNHGLQAMLAWHCHPACWLCLHLKINKKSKSEFKFLMYWIGLHLFNDDTCSSGHISRPKVSHAEAVSSQGEFEVPHWGYTASKVDFYYMHGVKPGILQKQTSVNWIYRYSRLTPKHRETHGCVVCTVATDVLVLKHQAISIHNAD